LRHKLACVGATGVLIAQMNLHVYEKTEMRVAEAQPSSVPPSPTSDLLGLSWSKADGMTRLPP
jgi:hypothetical protein